MRRFGFLLILLLLALLACHPAPTTLPQSPSTTPIFTLPSPTEEVISWEEAGNYIGQYKTVEGTIVCTYYAESSSGQPTFLNFHKPYRGYFKCVIWGEDRPKFPPNPEEYYLNKHVRVWGLIKSYKGAPEIVLYNPLQIRIVKPDGSWETNPFTQITIALVTKVIDGDTIEIKGGQRVRYIGINAPEVAHFTRPGECYGREATRKNRELVGGKKVRLERDIENKDKYGRLLRYVWVDHLMVNAELVRLGYARAYPYPPNLKYQDLFSKLEEEARRQRLGMWGKCR